MAKDQKRPMEGGIYKDGTQKNQDDRRKLDESPDSPKTSKKNKKNS